MTEAERRLYVLGLALRATADDVIRLLRRVFEQSEPARDKGSETMQAFLDGIKGE